MCMCKVCFCVCFVQIEVLVMCGVRPGAFPIIRVDPPVDSDRKRGEDEREAHLQFFLHTYIYSSFSTLTVLSEKKSVNTCTVINM